MSDGSGRFVAGLLEDFQTAFYGAPPPSQLERDQHRRKRLHRRVQKAQENLQTNIAAGPRQHLRVHRCAGASPLPIFLAHSTSATGYSGAAPEGRYFAPANGLAANFFIPNPDVDDVNVTDSGAFSDITRCRSICAGGSSCAPFRRSAVVASPPSEAD